MMLPCLRTLGNGLYSSLVNERKMLTGFVFARYGLIDSGILIVKSV